MKKFICSVMVLLVVGAANAQAPVVEDYIKLDNQPNITNYQLVCKSAILNQALVYFDGKNNPLLIVSLPANGNNQPVPGTYTIMDGKKKSIKKGSQIVKIQMEPNYQSIDDAGTMTIEERNGLLWFKADNVKMIDTKTKEMHVLNFYQGIIFQTN